MKGSPVNESQRSPDEMYAPFVAPNENTASPQGSTATSNADRVNYHFQFSQSHAIDLAERTVESLRAPRGAARLRKLLVIGLLTICYITLALPFMPPYAVLGGALFAIAISMMTLSNPQLDKARLIRDFQTFPCRDCDTSVTLNIDGLSSVNGIEDFRAAWSVFVKCHGFNDGLLLVKSPQQFIWLPDSAISEGTRDDAERLIRKHVTDFKVVETKAG